MPLRGETTTIERFRALAVAWVDAKPKVANKIMREIFSLAEAFTEDGRLGELLALLEDPHAAVRYAAANSLLDVLPERAVPVLEAISDGPKGILNWAAYTSLLMWRSGSGKVH